MPDTSARLALPYIQPSQAQKHVTHNEALRQLDLLVQLRVAGFDAVTPPADPQDGNVYALGTGATGVWAGQDGRLASYTDTIWTFHDPQEGWLASALTDPALHIYTNAGWQKLLDGLDTLGIGAAADAINRLSVAAQATLLTHEGAGHQLKINKAAAPDTASLLYQSGFSGHAEMGLAGDNSFSVKVSPDGASWATALRLDKTTGHATGNAVQASATDTTPGRLMRADYGYGPGNALGSVSENAGAPTGALIERGNNANGSYTKYADGTLLCWQSQGVALDTISPLGQNFSSGNETWTFPASFVDDNIFMAAFPDVVTRWCAVRVVSNSTGIYRQISTGNSATQYATRLHAIGRWF